MAKAELHKSTISRLRRKEREAAMLAERMHVRLVVVSASAFPTE